MILVVPALLLVTATALPLLRLDHWWIRVLDFPRSQITIAGMVVLAVQLCSWDTRRAYGAVILRLLVLAVGYQAVKMPVHSADAQAVTDGRVVLGRRQPQPARGERADATRTTARDAELLILGREAEKRDEPTIVAGDFNDVGWSYTTSLVQKASGLLDPRIGRGTYSTYHTRNVLVRWPLDHVFHSDHFKLVRIETGPAWGSDHFPMFIELSLEPAAEAEQEAPDTNRAEAKRVAEKIEDGRQRTDG